MTLQGSCYPPRGGFVSAVTDLLVAITGLVGALASAYVLVRSARQRKTPDTAELAATTAAKAMLEAVVDGTITPDEWDEIRRGLGEGGS